MIRKAAYATFTSIFFFKQKTAYEIRLSLVGSEMCIRDRTTGVSKMIAMYSYLNIKYIDRLEFVNNSISQSLELHFKFLITKCDCCLP